MLTTDHSGIFDTFSPGRNGYGVEKRSVTSIQEAIGSAVPILNSCFVWRRIIAVTPMGTPSPRLIKTAGDRGRLSSARTMTVRRYRDLHKLCDGYV